MKTFLISLSIFCILLISPIVIPSTIHFNNNLFSQELKEEEETLPQSEQEQPKEKKKEVQPEEELKEGVEKEELPEYKRYYKEKYEEHYTQSFEVVWNTIKEAITAINCMVAYEKYRQNEQGLYQGLIKSDYCVLSTGKDTTVSTMKKYSLDFPLIRGAIWLNGSIQYRFNLKEKDDGSVDMVMTTEMNGYEDFVTHEVHFWKGNGILEKRMLDLIKKLLSSK